MSLADFNEALSTVLPAEMNTPFESLQKEQIENTNQAAHDIRIDPVEENPVTWSLSQWADLRVDQLVQLNEQAETDIPAEIREIRNVFPDFFNAYPDAN